MRQQCSTCHYPVKTCICHAVQPVSNLTEVIVLQHPKESLHAKNTVRLLQLALTKISTYVGKSADDFSPLRHKLSTDPKPTAVFYPSPDSSAISAVTSRDTTRITRVIFIDSSWKQAFGIWQNNPWLNQFTFYQLPAETTGQYHIRQSKLQHSLSTLEAVAYGLYYVEQLDPKPLVDLLCAFTQRWQTYIPVR
ncbi:tRNA-uridine aminocarboxypropyltransferase [Alteromonas lipolytica]|uniref:tRNA-uridine aminocarboxypropyltransferase n=1 Tax=Alteromonas lipolytica TaxID=1856405 RepID=A0A1E8FAE9_9ALTE|nr:tRNA-uridine aminocarboxypropyltransferase [Alteromonas lipolytica]OFI32902.1 hypothetical protein BFC17_01100 [Alteromonas lipolytica]